MQRLENPRSEESSECEQSQNSQVDMVSSEKEALKACNKIHMNITGADHVGMVAEWTVVHGFYAAMGGFVFELDEEVASALGLPDDKPRRLTITPCGLTILAECGLLPDISERDIQDKSKADGLAKAIACLQAGWMVLQTTARIAYGLPVTLLEVNTIGHVVCAALIYALWWHKPRLIQEPTVIRGSWVPKVAAYLWLHSQESEKKPTKRGFIFGRTGVSELAHLAFIHDSSLGLNQDASAKDKSRPVVDQIRTIPCLAEYSDCVSASEIVRGGPQAANVRWKLALEAASEFPVLRRRLEEISGRAQHISPNPQSEILIQDRAGNWSSRGLLTTFRGVLMGMALWFASIAFGALHVAAWNDYFPSELEAWLWRASSLDIVGSGLVWIAINFLGQISKRFDHFWDDVMAGQGTTWSYVVLCILCSICGLAYGFARIFLVVESVISLRQLPAQAYVVPDWTLLIPHL